MVDTRVPFMEVRQQDTCPIDDLVTFLRDYPNVSNVFIVRRLVARIHSDDTAFNHSMEETRVAMARVKKLEAAMTELHNQVDQSMGDSDLYETDGLTQAMCEAAKLFPDRRDSEGASTP